MRTVDPDQQPGLASRYGVRVYNVAVLETEGRRVQVVTTEDRDLALGYPPADPPRGEDDLLRGGHGEYDIDNMEYHTHFEGVHAHSHGAEGIGVVLMEQHGVGRLRRALESLGFTTKKVTLATAGRVPASVRGPRGGQSPHACTRHRRARPSRTTWRGAAQRSCMYDIDFPVEPTLAAVLAKAGHPAR